MKKILKVIGIVLAVLLLLALIVPLVYPVPPLTDTKSERELADADGKFIDVNGLSVHYKEAGEGETTYILLHGFGASVFSWHEVIAPMAEMGRVIAYDRPAFGLTSRPMPGEWTGASPYSTQSNVDLLLGLMDALGVQKAVLVGNSAGGTVAAWFAVQHPERVEALVLVDPAISRVSRGSGGPFPAWLKPVAASPQLRRIGPLLVRSIASSGNDTIRLAWHDPSKVTPEILEGYRKPLMAHNWDRALYEFSIAPQLGGLFEQMQSLDMPILVMTGDDDRIVPTANSIDLAGGLEGSVLEVIPECGHLPHEEHPGVFMDVLQKFMLSASP